MKEEHGQQKPDESVFPVVGIGSSAGGVEALRTLFTALSPKLKAAFILVQHLQPDRPSMLVDILSRVTKMPLVEAKEGMKIEAGHAYMIPPGKFLSLDKGVLSLTSSSATGVRMPIDFLFRSLAKEKGEASIGIVLSGAGSDGTTGLREMHGAGGITIVQEPSSAQYPQMPESAISTGIADHVVPPEQIGRLLERYVQQFPMAQPQVTAEEVEPVTSQLLAALRQSTGHDFSPYKMNTVLRRVRRRMNVLNIREPQEYLTYLGEHREEAALLFRDLLIRVTSFFRDPGAYVALAEEILPKLLSKLQDGDAIRVWVTGCSTGEEAYSLMMLLDEFSRSLGKRFEIHMFATDIDGPSVELARTGFYPLDIAADVSEERLHRFFTAEDHGYRIKKELREKIVFAVQNVLKDPPFTKLDLVSCRNLMIYLRAEAQKRLLEAFHYSLNRGGILFLGASETIGNRNDLFEVVGRKWKFCEAKPRQGYPVFRTATTSGVYRRHPASFADGQPKEVTAKEAAKNEILEHFSPPCVVVDEVGGIVHIQGQTARFLEPAPGGPRFNLYDMAKKGLRSALRTTLHRAIAQKAEAASPDLTIDKNGGQIGARVKAKPLSNVEGLYIVVFEEVSLPHPHEGARGAAGKKGRRPDEKRTAELEEELRRTREDFRIAIEELQTAIEEQKSTSEELQSSNEELQSTNEELETSKEELQSINEELVTVNAELEEKVRQLARAESDIKNLLDSVNVGAIFVDTELRIGSFTTDIKQVANMLPSDIGRPVRDIATSLLDVNLTEEAQKVLETLQAREKDVRTKSGEWYLMRVRPYRTSENVIGGIVITFNNVTIIKKAAHDTAVVEQIRVARDFAQATVDTVKQPLVTLSEDLRIVTANRSFYRMLGLREHGAEGKPIYEIADNQLDIPELRRLLEQVLPRDSFIENYAMTYHAAGGQQKRLLLNARAVATSESFKLPFILIGIEDTVEQESKSSS